MTYEEWLVDKIKVVALEIESECYNAIYDSVYKDSQGNYYVTWRDMDDWDKIAGFDALGEDRIGPSTKFGDS